MDVNSAMKFIKNIIIPFYYVFIFDFETFVQ